MLEPRGAWRARGSCRRAKQSREGTEHNAHSAVMGRVKIRVRRGPLASVAIYDFALAEVVELADTPS